MTDITPPSPPPPPPDPAIILQPEFKEYRKYEITEDSELWRILSGIAPPPNFEPIPHWKALDLSIGLYGRTVERVKAKGQTYENRCKAKINGHFGDAIYYLNCGQGGGFTGEGVVVLSYYGHGYTKSIDTVITGKFSICLHEKVEGAGANHMRGWHPGYCSKCGLDMSVDSGD